MSGTRRPDYGGRLSRRAKIVVVVVLFVLILIHRRWSSRGSRQALPRRGNATA